jgi:hypothetical protein
MGESTIKSGKIITAVTAPTIRAIVNIARELDIKRDDIVTLTKEGHEFILIYYGEN